MLAEAEEHDYRAHEFGDAVFIERLVDVGAERVDSGSAPSPLTAVP